MFEDNPIIIDVNSKRNKKQKILCVLCKVQLECTNLEAQKYRCPRCKNIYQLGYEINEFEDEFESSHEDEDIELRGIESDSNIGLLSANDNELEEEDSSDNRSGEIKVPKYFKDSSTTKVLEYREE